MSDASLKAVVGADVSGFVSGIQTAQQKLSELYAKLDEAKSRQSNLIDPGNIKAANVEISALTKQIDALGNNQGFASLGKSATGFVGTANEAYSAIRKLAYILPGIGIAGIFNLAFEGIASAFSSSNKAVDDSAAKLDAYNKVVDSVVSSNSKESTSVDALVGKLQSGTLTRQQTVDAIKELQKISADYFGKLNAEKASVEDVTKAYGNYNNALISSIENQVRIAELNDLVKQRLTQTNATPDAASFIANLQQQGKSLSDINAIVTKGIGDEIKGNAQILQGSKYISDEKLKQSLLDSKIPAGTQTVLSLLQKEADLIGQINGTKDLVSGGDSTTQNENLSYLEKTKTLIESIGKADTGPLFKAFQNVDQSGVGKSVAGSVEGGLAGVNYQIYKDSLAKATADAAKGAITPETFNNYAAALKDAFNKNSSPDLTSRIPFTIDDSNASTLKDKINILTRGEAKELKPMQIPVIAGFDQAQVAQMQKDAQKLAKNLSSILTSGISEGIGNVADAIGGALGSGGNILKAAGSSILSTLGDLIEQLGKALLVYGAAQEAVEISFESFNPIVALAAGAIAVAAGAALKATATQPRAFATGGIVTGPTNALIGEAGPEVVFPLDKLNRFIKTGTGNSPNMAVSGEFRLQGTNLIAAINRTNKAQGYVS